MENEVGLLPRSNKLNRAQQKQLARIVDRLWGYHLLPYAQVLWLHLHDQPLTEEMKAMVASEKAYVRESFDYPRVNAQAFEIYTQAIFPLREPVHVKP